MEAADTPRQASTNATPAQGTVHQLPKQLEGIVAATQFQGFRHRWNTNEEIASVLIAFDKHAHWQQHVIKVRPVSGSMLFYNRNRVRYRKDGYCWKKRKDGMSIREDHMKLKVQGLECIYGSYVHSAILPTFHRRCYWLLQNPDLVLVHYLNVPYPVNTKLTIPIVSFAMEKKEWTKGELFDQLHPMFSSCQQDRKQEVDKVVETLVQRLIDHQDKRNVSHKCDSMCDKNCVHSRSAVSGLDSGHLQPSVLSSMLTAGQTSGRTQTCPPSQGIPSSHTPFIVNLSNVSTNNLMLVSNQPHVNLTNMTNNNSTTTTAVSCAAAQPQEAAILHSESTGDLLGTAGPTLAPSLPYQSMVKTEDGQGTTPTRILRQDVRGTQLCEQTYYSQQPPMAVEQKSGDHLATNSSVPMQLVSDSVTGGGTDSVDTSQMGAFNFNMLSPGNAGNEVGCCGQDLGDSLDLSSLQDADLSLDQLDLLDLPDIEKLCCEMLTASPPSSQENKTLLTGSPCIHSVSSRPDEPSSSLNIPCVATSQCSLLSSAPSVSASEVYQSEADNSVAQSKAAAIISDFSPDWSYIEGQCKVLVTGPWYNRNSSYTVLIDGKVVGTTLVQPGVLRCFVPPHPAGLVTLQVSCDRVVISNTVVFEYRARNQPPTSRSCQCRNWFSVTDEELHTQLLQKLETVSTLLKVGPEARQRGVRTVPNTATLKQKLTRGSDARVLDSCLVSHIESLSCCVWNQDSMNLPAGHMGLSLLHLAAALGYQRFIAALIRWRTDSSCCFLQYEVDAHSMDLNSCSPLMWACAKGHLDAAVTLYNWNKGLLKSVNKEGNHAVMVARQHGHHQLADHISQLPGSQQHRVTDDVIQRSGSPLSPDFLHSSHVTETKTGSHLAATSTPNLKNGPIPIFKSPQIPTTGSQPLGTLHIEIPVSKATSKEKVTRRQSEQMLKLASGTSRQKLKKRLSVDALPNDSDHNNPSQTSSFERPIREANSEPHLSANMELMTREYNPMLCDPGRDITSPDMLVDNSLTMLTRLGLAKMTGAVDQSQAAVGQVPTNMDTDDVMSVRSSSPFIDVENVSSDDDDFSANLYSDRQLSGDGTEDSNHQMVHLAKQIIAAIPERIKLSPSRAIGDDITLEETERERSSSYSSLQSHSPHASSYGDDSGISTPMKDSLAFEEYRYSDLGTPASSLSPDSTCLPSPYSPYGFQLDSPPPTTADFTEYFNAPATFMEKDFSQLTLSDREQRKLYEAAKVIQSAYRTYRDKQFQQQRKEIEAAVLIQSYYRRYKQYAYYKKMTQAAVLIQSQFRSYYAQKRFKKRRDAAVVIQNQYRSYKEHERLKKGGNKSVIQRYRSHYQRKLCGPGGSEKGSRVVQMVPDNGDGCPPEANTTATGDCPPATEDAQKADGQTDKSCDQNASESPC